MPRVSVVVPHYSDFERLDLCLAALERQAFPRQQFEIVVADNDSPQGRDAVAKVVAGRARLTFVTTKGAGPARNGGVAAARGEVIAFTDSDCVPEPGWLAAGVQALARSDLVGGAMRVLVNDPARITPEEAFEVLFAFDNRGYVEKKGFSVSANLFCFRSTFERVGGFSTSKVSEDLEWCRRATAMGYALAYTPDAVVGHPARATWEELVHKWRRVNLESFGLAALEPFGRTRFALKTAALPISSIAHTPKALVAPSGLSLEQRWAALKVLYRLRMWRLRDSAALLSGRR